MNLGTKHPLIVRNVTVNTTLSGGGQPPSPRRPTRLVGIMSLATGLLRLSVSKVALSRDIDRRTVYRISNRYPLSDSGTAYSGTPPVIGTCFGCRVSAAGYLPQRAENNQLRGISGLVSRLYFGFLYSLCGPAYPHDKKICNAFNTSKGWACLPMTNRHLIIRKD